MVDIVPGQPKLRSETLSVPSHSPNSAKTKQNKTKQIYWGLGMSTLLQLLPCGPNDGDSDAVSSGLDGVTMSLHPMGVLLTCWMPTCVKERESLGSRVP